MYKTCYQLGFVFVMALFFVGCAEVPAPITSDGVPVWKDNDSDTSKATPTPREAPPSTGSNTSTSPQTPPNTTPGQTPPKAPPTQTPPKAPPTQTPPKTPPKTPPTQTPPSTKSGPQCAALGVVPEAGQLTTTKGSSHEQACKSIFTKYEIPPEEGGAELHIVGVYQTTSGRGARQHPVGNGFVHLDRKGPQVLVLTSYEPVHWKVTVSPGTQLQKVILSGYYDQTADVPQGTKVETYTYTKRNQWSEMFAYQWPSVRATKLVEVVEKLTRLSLSSFRGCYESTHFYIGKYTTVLKPKPSKSPTLLQQCPSITKESGYCVALMFDRSIGLFGLDSGKLCGTRIRVGSTLSSGYDASLGWIGEHVYVCDRSGGVVQISLRDGRTQAAVKACRAVTSSGCKVLVMDDYSGDFRTMGRVAEYNILQDISLNNPSKTYQGRFNDSRMASFGGILYTASHSSDHVSVFTSASTSTKKALKLQGHDGWIMGLDVTSKNELLIAAPHSKNAAVYIFDATTGKRLRSLQLGGQRIQGFKCFRK